MVGMHHTMHYFQRGQIADVSLKQCFSELVVYALPVVVYSWPPAFTACNRMSCLCQNMPVVCNAACLLVLCTGLLSVAGGRTAGHLTVTGAGTAGKETMDVMLAT